MTAQFSDKIRYYDKDYAIAGIRGKGLFHAHESGFQPEGKCSACWRGYLCNYTIQQDELLLERQLINAQPPFPSLWNTTPAPCKPLVPEFTPLFDIEYTGLQMPVSFSGRLLIANDFISDLYVHMGFHPAWKYREVHELIFRQGWLIEEHDRSEDAAQARERMQRRPLEPVHWWNPIAEFFWICKSFKRNRWL